MRLLHKLLLLGWAALMVVAIATSWFPDGEWVSRVHALRTGWPLWFGEAGGDLELRALEQFLAVSALLLLLLVVFLPKRRRLRGWFAGSCRVFLGAAMLVVFTAGVVLAAVLVELRVAPASTSIGQWAVEAMAAAGRDVWLADLEQRPERAVSAWSLAGALLAFMRPGRAMAVEAHRDEGAASEVQAEATTRTTEKELPASVPHGAQRIQIDGWSLELPAGWQLSKQARGRSVDKPYYAGPDGRFGVYPDARDAEAVGAGFRSLPMSMQLSGLDLENQRQDDIGGLRREILDAVNPATGARVRHVLFVSGSQGLRLTIHDYEGSQDAVVLRLISDHVSGPGAAGTQESKVEPPELPLPSAASKPARPSQPVKPALPAPPRAAEKPQVDPEQVRSCVIRLITVSLLEQKGIGAGIMSTLLQEARTYDGLHQMLGGGVASIKKCKGIGQKKAGVIDAVYRALGGRRALEAAARDYILRKRREQLIKTVLLVVGVVLALIWYASR